MAKIHIPTPLRQYAGKQATVEVKGDSIADALSGLVARHPDLRRHLYTDDGKLRAFVNVPQAYVPGIKIGTKARITVPEYPGRNFPATVDPTIKFRQLAYS